ncbi:cysteine hydrolase family protein [Tsukamurella soli]|uniref:Isochorismatase-like domain-containing protein n=1 Tax=Tsukamurella soli TaxID=644556 RepID=A0ABP8J0T4_9ACTN
MTTVPTSSRRARIAAALALVATLVAACGGSTTTAASTATITVAAPTRAAASGARPALDPAHTALLVMDMQQGIVSELSASAGTVITHTAAAEQAARRAGVHVVLVGTAFQAGYPEVSQNNKAFARVIGSGSMLQGSPESQFDPRIAAVGNEPVVIKARVGAFGSTPLREILRAGHIQTLVLTGIATSGVVLSTLRVAADDDYRIIVLSDCVADPDPEVQRVLLDKVFPTQADVMTSAAFDAELAT